MYILHKHSDPHGLHLLVSEHPLSQKSLSLFKKVKVLTNRVLSCSLLLPQLLAWAVFKIFKFQQATCLSLFCAAAKKVIEQAVYKEQTPISHGLGG